VVDLCHLSSKTDLFRQVGFATKFTLRVSEILLRNIKYAFGV